MELLKDAAIYIVVEFSHDKSIGIVREGWLQNITNKIYTYWPPYWKDGNKLKKAIKTDEIPNVNSWTLYTVKIITGYGE